MTRLLGVVHAGSHVRHCRRRFTPDEAPSCSACHEPWDRLSLGLRVEDRLGGAPAKCAPCAACCCRPSPGLPSASLARAQHQPGAPAASRAPAPGDRACRVVIPAGQESSARPTGDRGTGRRCGPMVFPVLPRRPIRWPVRRRCPRLTRTEPVCICAYTAYRRRPMFSTTLLPVKSAGVWSVLARRCARRDLRAVVGGGDNGAICDGVDRCSIAGAVAELRAIALEEEAVRHADPVDREDLGRHVAAVRRQEHPTMGRGGVSTATVEGDPGGPSQRRGDQGRPTPIGSQDGRVDDPASNYCALGGRRREGVSDPVGQPLGDLPPRRARQHDVDERLDRRRDGNERGRRAAERLEGVRPGRCPEPRPDWRRSQRPTGSSTSRRSARRAAP